MSEEAAAWRQRIGPVALVALSLFGSAPARADYAITNGDVLDIAVAGMPALRRRMTVNADGSISYPLIGNVAVAGLSVEGVRARLQGLLAERKLASNPDVTIEIAEYRPVYVMGDVLKPGAYPFRPGLSVRNSVALAGGYDVAQMHGRNPLLEAATARGEFQLAAVELAKQQARIARLKAELAGQPEPDLSALQGSPVRPEALAEISRVENQQLRLDLESRAKEKDYYDRLRKAAEDQIAQVAQEEDFWSTSVKQQTADLSRVQGFLQSAVGTVARVEAAQQNLMVSESRLFDARGRLAQLRRDLSEVSRKQDAAADEVRSTLLQQLREAVVELTKSHYAVDVASDKMRLSGSARLQREAAAPQVVIYEASDPPKPGTRASEDTMLSPGETIEITFADQFTGAPWGFGSPGDAGPAQAGDAQQRGANPPRR